MLMLYTVFFIRDEIELHSPKMGIASQMCHFVNLISVKLFVEQLLCENMLKTCSE